MASFRIIEHQVPCQHVREYPQATATSQEGVLYLAVKQYLPLSNLEPQAGDVTFIAAAANGLPKELYEPLWDDLEACTRRDGVGIRSIWVADVAQQGASSTLNSERLGNGSSWHDHARDLMHLINVKRADMPRPLVGIGHSFGGNQMVSLALMHPRLLTTVVLIDPTIVSVAYELNSEQLELAMARQSTFRRILWGSREEAAASFQRSPFYQAWDPRVL